MPFAKSVFMLAAFCVFLVAQPPSSGYNLNTCAESVASDVPTFYQKYFKCMTITKSGDYSVFDSNGLPPHESWYWNNNHPNNIEYVSQGTGYYQNPNVISPQDILISIPNSPVSRGLAINSALVDGVVGTSSYEYTMGTAGLALDGVSLFNSLAGPGDDIWEEIYTFDYYNAHPDADGTYHYHTVTKGPLEVLEHNGLITNTTPGSGEIEVYGMMCDGTIVMGCTELDGSVPNSSDLDAQNGHVHDLVDEDGVTQFSNRYHTHMCWAQFPNHKLTPEIQYYSDCLMEQGFSLSPTSLGFGVVLVGQSSQMTFSVSNPGVATLTVSSINPSGAPFVTSPTNFTVPAGGSQTVTVTFTPTSASTYSRTATITHNASGGTATVLMTGTGGAPSIAITPTSLSLGQVVLGQSSEGTLTVANPGTSALTVSSVTSSNEAFTVSPTSFTVSAGGSQAVAVTFTPTAAQSYSATVTLTHDASGGSSQVAVVGTGLSNVPVALDQSVTTQEDTPMSIVLSGTDVEGDTLTFAIAAQPVFGTVVLSGDSATYTPFSNYNGSDSFTFTASDGSLTSSPATVSITVTVVNDPPVMEGMSNVLMPEDGATLLQLEALDVDGDALSFTASTVSLLAVQVLGDRLRIVPGPNWNGEAEVMVWVSDGAATDSTGFTVTVTPVNDAPMMTMPLGDTSVSEDDYGAVVVMRLEDHFGDVDEGDILSFSAGALDPGLDSVSVGSFAGSPLVGMLTSSPSGMVTLKRSRLAEMLGGDGRGISRVKGGVSLLGAASSSDTTALVVYPSPNFNGQVRVAVTAEDPSMTVAADTMVVAVSPVNDAPVLGPLFDVTMQEDGARFVVAQGMDPDGNPLSYWAYTGEPGLAVSVDGDTITLQPSPDWNGQAMVSAGVTDGMASDSTSFQVTVTPVNDAPSELYLNCPQDWTQISITPENVGTDSVIFCWTSAQDVDGDPVHYQMLGIHLIRMGETALDTLFFGGEWTDALEARVPYSEIFNDYAGYAGADNSMIRWRVKVTDGVDTTVAGNGPFHLAVDASVMGVKPEALPAAFALHPNFPNPFNPSTVIRYDLPEAGMAELKVYDLLGRMVRTLVSGLQEPGYRQVVWDGRDDAGQVVPAGVYLYRLATGQGTLTKKLVLMR